MILSDVGMSVEEAGKSVRHLRRARKISGMA